MKMMRSRLYDLEIEKRQAATRKLDETKLDISFGSQIRTYTLQPYRLIKDHRTKFEVGDVDRVLNGDLDPFIRNFLLSRRKGTLGKRCRWRATIRRAPALDPLRSGRCIQPRILAI